MKNKKRYRFSDDGRQFDAASALEVVKFMRDTGRFTASETIAEYMEGFADRYETQTGCRVRCNNVTSFVADLQYFEFLTEVSTELPANFI